MKIFRFLSYFFIPCSDRCIILCILCVFARISLAEGAETAAFLFSAFLRLCENKSRRVRRDRSFIIHCVLCVLSENKSRRVRRDRSFIIHCVLSVLSENKSRGVRRGRSFIFHCVLSVFARTSLAECAETAALLFSAFLAFFARISLAEGAETAVFIILCVFARKSPHGSVENFIFGGRN